MDGAESNSDVCDGAGWIACGTVNDIPPRGARVIHALVADVALFRTDGDQVFAIEDFCPHKGAPLSLGLVAGDTVICPLHSWAIHLKDGRVALPNDGRVRSFPVRIADGRVFVQLFRGGG